MAVMFTLTSTEERGKNFLTLIVELKKRKGELPLRLQEASFDGLLLYQFKITARKILSFAIDIESLGFLRS